MNEIIINIISVVVTSIVLPLISIAGAKLIQFINSKIKNNKAADLLIKKGLTKNFPKNYIESIDEITYAKLYSSIRLSQKIRSFSLE